MLLPHNSTHGGKSHERTIERERERGNSPKKREKTSSRKWVGGGRLEGKKRGKIERKESGETGMNFIGLGFGYCPSVKKWSFLRERGERESGCLLDTEIENLSKKKGRSSALG